MTMKPITGQYECLHNSGVGLDYFTSRIDRLTLLPNGRFTLIVQDRSRLSNAAQSLLSGQQVSTAAPETRREGNYIIQQGNSVLLRFDDGTQQQAQLSWNGEGLQIGQDFFNKVSDSTVLPPTHRLKKDMDDIAKGLKIAGAIGSIAIKAAKGIHETIQSAQQSNPNQAPPAQNPSSVSSQPLQAPPSPVPPAQSAQRTGGPPPVQPVLRPVPSGPSPVPPAQPVQQATPQPSQVQPQGRVETLFCDQCGARCRPGKRFCSQCGAQLP
jgi:hypothetical protein